MNISPPQTRRQFLRHALLLAAGGAFGAAVLRSRAGVPEGFQPLFDGKTLKGWTPKPRPAGKAGSPDSFYERTLKACGRWTIQDGAIVGEQDPPGSGLGGYLVSDEAFADFELLIDAKPDWPADTGIYVRATPDVRVGFQVLLDHRPHGGIGGYYGNGLGSFHAWRYGFAADKDSQGRLVRLIPEKAVEPNRNNYTIPLDFSAPADVFLRTWKLNEWNRFRIRSAGALPRLTTWINGEKISELDAAKIQAPGYDPQRVLSRLGRAGRISLEVHSSGPGDPLGKDRWGSGAACRWRNIFIKRLPEA
jgi:hypothetical protein